MHRIVPIVFLLVGNHVTLAQGDKLKPTYDFSLPREEKIKLAESAAPPEISGKATVYVLERSGYTKAREGTNGFSCFVDRQTPWNTEPTCFDVEGTRTNIRRLRLSASKSMPVEFAGHRARTASGLKAQPRKRVIRYWPGIRR